MGHGLILAGILFALGLAGLLMRRNLVFILLSIEIMLNGAGVAFVAAGSRWGAARWPDHVSLHPGHGGGRSFHRLWRCSFASIASTTRSTPMPQRDERLKHARPSLAGSRDSLCERARAGRAALSAKSRGLDRSRLDCRLCRSFSARDDLLSDAPPAANAYTQVLWTWLDVGGFRPEIALYLDPLSLIMVVVVAFVSFLIHLYSTEFMIGDDGYSRFFAYMNLFVASMLTLLLADNLLAALPGMGRRRSVQLSAHRVLVSRSGEWPGRTQSIHRDPRRRYRPDDRAVSALP